MHNLCNWRGLRSAHHYSDRFATDVQLSNNETFRCVKIAGSVIAVNPKCDFAGVVLASQSAGKENTMDSRMNLLETMSERG